MQNLGYMYYFGLRPDFKLAAKYFAAAAEAGHGRAAFYLGRRISGVRAKPATTPPPQSIFASPPNKAMVPRR